VLAHACSIACVSIRQHKSAHVSTCQHTLERRELVLADACSKYLYLCTSEASKLSTSVVVRVLVYEALSY
jgi:hypothetical protein